VANFYAIMTSQAIVNTDDIDWLEEFDRSFVIDVGKSLKTLTEDYEELDIFDDLTNNEINNDSSTQQQKVSAISPHHHHHHIITSQTSPDLLQHDSPTITCGKFVPTACVMTKHKPSPTPSASSYSSAATAPLDGSITQSSRSSSRRSTQIFRSMRKKLSKRPVLSIKLHTKRSNSTETIDSVFEYDSSSLAGSTTNNQTIRTDPDFVSSRSVNTTQHHDDSNRLLATLKRKLGRHSNNSVRDASLVELPVPIECVTPCLKRPHTTEHLHMLTPPVVVDGQVTSHFRYLSLKRNVTLFSSNDEISTTDHTLNQQLPRSLSAIPRFPSFRSSSVRTPRRSQSKSSSKENLEGQSPLRALYNATVIKRSQSANSNNNHVFKRGSFNYSSYVGKIQESHLVILKQRCNVH